MARFAADGVAGATVRAIAADAGVSPALVLHHFGSKDGLWRACDEYVMDLTREQKRQAMEGGAMADPGFLGGAYQLASPIMRYLAAALASGSPAAAELFDDMVEESARLLALGEELGKIRPSADPQRRAAVLVAMQLGQVVLHEHLSRTLGVDTTAPEGLATLSGAALEIFADGLFVEEFAAETRAALEAVATDPGAANRSEDDGDG